MTTRLPAWTGLLAAYALANLTLGLVLVITQPFRADDVWIVYEWCRDWLLHGQEMYAGADARTDYPPNAIVLLSPLGLLARTWVVPAWTALTLALTPVSAYLIVRVMSPRAWTTAAVVPILLFLCWGGTRTFLEFSRLSMTLAFAAALMADAQPTASGVSLGLALAKPHIAGPVALWILVTRRIRIAGIAALVVGAGWVVYCVRAHVSPFSVLLEYRAILDGLFAGPDAMLGLTSLQPWWLAIGGSSLGTTLWAVGAGVLLLVPFVLALYPGEWRRERSTAALALFCLWSLLTIYHISSNIVVLMFPAFAFLLLFHSETMSRGRLMLLAAIQAAMMFDIPVHLAAFVPLDGVEFILVRDVDRIVALAAFVAVAFTGFGLLGAGSTPDTRVDHGPH